MTRGLPVVKAGPLVVQALPSPPLPFTYLLIANKCEPQHWKEREKLDKLVEEARHEKSSASTECSTNIRDGTYKNKYSRKGKLTEKKFVYANSS